MSRSSLQLPTRTNATSMTMRFNVIDMYPGRGLDRASHSATSFMLHASMPEPKQGTHALSVGTWRYCDDVDHGPGVGCCVPVTRSQSLDRHNGAFDRAYRFGLAIVLLTGASPVTEL